MLELQKSIMQSWGRVREGIICLLLGNFVRQVLPPGPHTPPSNLSSHCSYNDTRLANKVLQGTLELQWFSQGSLG